MATKRYEYPKISAKKTGARLRSLCKSCRISVCEIQKELGLSSNQAVYSWFNGKNLPSLDNFYALSRLLGVAMDAIAVDEEACEEEAVLPERASEYHADEGDIQIELAGDSDANRCLRYVCVQRLLTYHTLLENMKYA
ncbi:MAG: helix-turn-helix domain-containing protein [Lachnospiraceae bacterium]|nr:helix-turn-helix domain-containing protein [Lachnospiraceae bacterium]